MRKTQIITRTALFLALLIAVQYMTAPLGTYITGSAVNLILIMTCLLVGTKPAVAVAIISPFVAKLFGIGNSLLPIVPVVAAANVVLVSVYAVVGKTKLNIVLKWIVAIVTAALLKYAVLAVGVVKIMVPLLGVAEGVASKLSVAFGITQFITALVGGEIAAAVVPLIKRHMNKSTK